MSVKSSMSFESEQLNDEKCESFLTGTRYVTQCSQIKKYPKKCLRLPVLTLLTCCALVIVTLVTCILIIVYTFKHPYTHKPRCQAIQDGDAMELYRGSLNPFSELREEEIQNVVDFLFAQPNLKLTHPSKAGINSNYIHVIEMFLPPKKDVLNFFSHGRTPTRMARAYIFKGNQSAPVVEEYLVGPLPKPYNISLMASSSRKTSIPYTYRPFSKFEIKAFYKAIVPKIMGKIASLLKESYNATLSNCGKQCLRFLITPVSSGFLEEGRRKSWFWFAYDIEFYTLHPLDFQFLVDTTDVDPSRWEIQNVFYANQHFVNLDELSYRYNEGTINKTRLSFPHTSVEEQYSAVYLRGEAVPKDLKSPPQQRQPSGPRYTVNGNQVNYMDWRFHIRVSPTLGAQLFDIRYKSERIIYELSMQEIAVLYSGHTPAASMLYYADSAGLFGTRLRGMMPGVDCPDHGTLLDVMAYTSNEGGLKQLEKSVCIFEHNTGTLLRRHRAYGMSGAFYSGLVDYVLVVRVYICIINYDYILDFIFHNNGGVEVKISATGYLAASFYYPEEEKYGTRISDTVVAGLHHHLFHFKADIDVKGTDNRFQTMNIGHERKVNQWSHDPHNAHSQNFFIKDDKRTEKEALYNFDFQHPKNLLFYKNDPTPLGHTPAYRLIHKGMTKSIIEEDTGFEPSVSWGRHQMAVTKQKDDEISSSSMFAMWDAKDPVVNFTKFWEDNENIVDQDLVAWVTMGSYHIPQTENVPTTGTVGTDLSFFMVPFNYFREDPSLSSRDAVKIMPLDAKSPLSGAAVERYNTTLHYDCLAKKIDSELLTNSTFLFS
ncbi:putative amine oxidase [copper-containing] [Biomphalaria glabrata]|uniref:Amine oxidase n=2 Tax=Biomphalaria glabrata TaxID=6526 RepID=A0A9W2ZPG3_BIOGL|nr:putative amine oxidase [copper-containing] [Biomphalaria glabrata]